MHIYNFGSMNLDHVYSVEHFVQPGETMSSRGYQVCCGGKGLNQSLAAARAGGEVYHAGLYGAGGEVLVACLRESGVHTELLRPTQTAQGHTVIQVSQSGENCIILCPGSNYELTRNEIDALFARIEDPGYLLVQNEVSQVPYLIHKAAGLGFQVVFNASPFTPALLELDYRDVAWLMINEVEGAQFSGSEDPERILSYLAARYPKLGVVLTLGSAGCICMQGSQRVSHGIFEVPVVDTTAAGDTFTGFFVAALSEGKALSEAVAFASAASALAVTSAGAAPSIPMRAEALALLRQGASIQPVSGGIFQNA